MTDGPTTLSTAQVREEAPADWRQLRGRLRARFRSGDFATGLDLVSGIGAVAEAADHPPEVLLTPTDVVVTLTGRDVHGITDREIDLARQISTVAAERGIAADVSGLTQLELGLDTSLGPRLAAYYAALLGGEVDDQGEPVDPSGQTPTVWWQDTQDADEGFALPEQSFEQRWHVDVWVPHDEGERRLQAVLDAGGRLVSDRGAPAYWVVEDAEGNRSCICTPTGR